MARIDLIGVCKTLDDGERRGATFRIEDLSLTVPDGRTQPATREHHRVAVELIFKEHASLGERPCAQIAPADLEDVEADVDRRRAQNPGVVVVAEEVNRLTSSLSKTATSASSTRTSAGSFAMAAASSRKRAVWSTALREIRLTCGPSL
jgi:hypothetical protein